MILTEVITVMNSREITKLSCGAFGTILSSLGSNSTQEVESITSIVCTILGLLITITSCVIIPLAKKIISAKKDGKITADEVNDIIDTLDEGLNKIHDALPKNDEKDDDGTQGGDKR